LLVLRGVVLGVLADVAVLARHADALGDAGAPVNLQLLELGLQANVGLER
jgi:hypothetical protein